MIELVITCDNRDSDLGDYFVQCRTDLEDFVTDSGILHNKHVVTDRNVNQVYVDVYLSEKLNPNNFLFIAYSHGTANALHSGEFGRYVLQGINTSLFLNSFFYSNACLVGESLGIDLQNNGCHVFIGYKKSVWKYLNHTMPTFVACDNHGIKCFIGSDITAYEAYTSMYVKHTEEIDKLVAQGELFAAADLREARDSLTFYGNQSARLTDLYNQVV